MRSSGYLDRLVQTARVAAPTASAVRSSRVLGWGPTRRGNEDGGLEDADPPVTPRTSPRSADSSPRRVSVPPPTPGEEPPASEPPARSAGERSDARPPVATPPPATALPRSPLVTSTASSPPLIEERRIDAPRRPVRRDESAPRTVEPTASRADASASIPRIPAGSEAALERLDQLTRRLSPLVPAERGPSPVPRADTVRPPATAEPRDREPLPAAIATAPRQVSAPGREQPPRVEIGSIEVFVAPAATPPAAAPVAPAPALPVSSARVPEAPVGRLSRPPHHYGFGQG